MSESDLSTPEDFFESRIDKIKDTKYTKISKPRNCISKHTAGKAVTEDKTFEKIKTFQSERSSKSKQRNIKPEKIVKAKSTKGTSATKNAKCDIVTLSQNPGPSHIFFVSDNDDIGSNSEIQEEEKCCICNKFTPDEVRNSVALIFTKWVQCSNEKM